MIRELSGSSDLGPYDLCVVGTGPAGTTVVNELVDSGLRICVLESGRRVPTPYGDRLRRVVSDGIEIKEYSRERVLGGASTTWAGLSSPLEPIELAPRPWAKIPGWPIAAAELAALYGEAVARYRFPPPASFEADGFARLRSKGELQPAWQRIDEKVFLACSEPQDFGREWRAAFEAPGVDLWLDATLLRLEGEPGTSRVRAGVVRSSGGAEARVLARAFVLATGGIENARLLLVSRDQCPAGLGNEYDQVGRCLMNHPKNYRGVLHLARPARNLPYYFGCLHGGFAGYAGLRLAPAEQRRLGLLHSYVRLEPLFPWTDSRGVEALVVLVKASGSFFRRWKARRAGEVVELRDYSETGDDTEFRNKRRGLLGHLALCGVVLADLPKVCAYAWHRLRRRAKPPVKRARLRNFMEMAPDPDNRVTLAEETDEHGRRLPLVRHACRELDRRSLVLLHEALAAEFERAGVGRLESDLARAEPWPIDQDASHHMGTTRMGTDPRSSVVDPELRLHGVENVWLAGASVFPTSGCANPTMTIVALSIRLSRTLRTALAQAVRA
jgi:choline dehydrogenase-like flavoprotein